MPAITGVAHVELSVADLDRSVDWYCALLGARDIFRDRNEKERISACAIFEPQSKMVMAFTQHFDQLESTFSARRVGLDHLSFRVATEPELHDWVARLNELGIANHGIQDDGYAWSLTFNDPDGIALELTVSKPRES